MPNRQHTTRAAGIAAFSVLLLAASVAFGQTYVGTTSNDFGPQMIANSPTDNGIWVEADATGKLLVSTTPAAGTTTAVNLTQVLGAAHSATNPVYVEASTALSARIPAALGAGGGFKVDGSGTALPVSAASLPLPAGASTSALQGAGLPAALGAGGGVKVDGSGTALPMSAASLPLPTGASTSALQGAGLPAALGAGGGVKIDGSGTALPMSAAALPLPTGASTSALQGAGLPAALGAGGGVKIDGSGTALPMSAATLPLPTGAATSALQGAGLPAALGAGGGVKIDGSGTAVPISGSVTATVASTTLTATVLPAASTTPETSALGFQVGIAATLMGTATAGRKSIQIHNPGGSGRSVYCGVSIAVTATNANSIWEIEAGQNWIQPFPTATTIYCIAALATYTSWTQLF